MDATGLLFIAFILTYIGVLVYVANQVEAARLLNAKKTHQQQISEAGFGSEPNQTTILRWMLYGLIAMMASVGFIVLQVAFLNDVAAPAEAGLEELQIEVSIVTAVSTFLISALLSFLSYRVVATDSMRQRLHGWLNRWGNYNPDSPVHTTAFVLMLAMVIWTMVTFVVQGGISGMAAELAESSVDVGDLFFQAFIEIVVALLGVGLAIRRDWSQTMARLGLRLPTRDDLVWGIGTGVVLMIVAPILTTIWMSLASPEMWAEQTAAAEALNSAFATVPLAFILAISAALGEEIWVRGSLQPVFGIFFSSLFFVVLHTQVALTPGVFIIFLISLGLGGVRQRHSTTAAIIAHFIYDFVPLLFLSLIVTS